MVFHEASGLDAVAVATGQAPVRQRVLRACLRRGLLAPCDRDQMGGWAHGGGFSLAAAVRVEGADLAGRERLLRYCARPPFALDHVHQHDAEHLVYPIPKPRPDGPRTLVLTPLALIDKVAALVPSPRVHRHRYYGVLAPNAPLRAAVTALAPVCDRDDACGEHRFDEVVQHPRRDGDDERRTQRAVGMKFTPPCWDRRGAKS